MDDWTTINAEAWKKGIILIWAVIMTNVGIAAAMTVWV